MKSPFPGMDPYLEQHWADVHASLMAYIRDFLQPQLSDDLIARMEQYVYVESEDDDEVQRRRPDVSVVQSPTPWQPQAGAASTAVLDEPMLLEPVGEPMRQRHVVVYDSAGHRIVTAIEVLSPWNKSPGKAVAAYMEKRERFIDTDTNLVEIDLVRTGDWTSMIGAFHLPPRARTTYRVTVTQPKLTGLYHYPIAMNAKLPTIKIPLRAHDTPARLDLQELMQKAYEMGRYNRIDYSQPCVPPLVGAEQAWAAEALSASGKR